jgi:hypothetical protein
MSAACTSRDSVSRRMLTCLSWVAGWRMDSAFYLASIPCRRCCVNDGLTVATPKERYLNVTGFEFLVRHPLEASSLASRLSGYASSTLPV